VVEEDGYIKRTDAAKPHLKRKRKPEKSEDEKKELKRQRLQNQLEALE
jgi:hypothetical protein